MRAETALDPALYTQGTPLLHLRAWKGGRHKAALSQTPVFDRADVAFLAAGLLFSGISLILKKTSGSNSNSLSEQTAALCRVSLPSFDFV